MKNQQGLSLASFLVFLIAAGFVFITGVRCIPAWVEHRAIERTVEKLANSDVTDVKTLKSMFAASAEIDDIKSVTPEDLSIYNRDGKNVISYSYEYRVRVIGNMSIVFDFTRG
jgi:hypothetical protein